MENASPLLKLEKAVITLEGLALLALDDAGGMRELSGDSNGCWNKGSYKRLHIT